MLALVDFCAAYLEELGEVLVDVEVADDVLGLLEHELVALDAVHLLDDLVEQVVDLEDRAVLLLLLLARLVRGVLLLAEQDLLDLELEPVRAHDLVLQVLSLKFPAQVEEKHTKSLESGGVGGKSLIL